MALITKRILLGGLMLLVNACVYHPHPFYGGGYGGGYYDHSYDHGGHHGGDGHHDRRHH